MQKEYNQHVEKKYKAGLKAADGEKENCDMTIEEMRARKRELGMTNEELAARSGVPLGTVQKVLAGATKAPRLKTLLALEKVLRKGRGFESERIYDFNRLPDDPEGGPDSVAESPAPYTYKKKQGEYTLEDYYAIPEDRRVELIDGVIYDMSAPQNIHQALSAELFTELNLFVRSQNGECMVYNAPFDVQLDRDDKTMIEPDIVVVCDREKLKRFGLYGEPDMIVEILSPVTRRKDITIKFRKYLDAGVKEYWLVYPEEKKIVAYHDLQGDQIPTVYTFEDKVPVHIWSDLCMVDFERIYSRIRFLYEL